MSNTPGQAIANVEEKLQSVMTGLERFQKASEQLERGQESLEEVAKQTNLLLAEARQILAPALEAVAALRSLHPDTLLSQVTAAATTVQEQLNRMEQYQASEFQNTRSILQGAASQFQIAGEQLTAVAEKVSSEVKAMNHQIIENLRAVASPAEQTRAMVFSGRKMSLTNIGLTVINLVLLVLLYFR